MESVKNPYEAPQSPMVAMPEKGMPTQADSPYGPMRDHSVIGKIVQVLLGCYAVLGLCYMIYSLKLAGEMEQGVNPFYGGDLMLDESVYYSYMGMSWGISLLFVLTVIFFSIWTNRSMKNAWATPGFMRPSMTPGWAVGYYFIPIMFLFRPLEGMKIIWDRTFRGKKSQAIVTTWWIVWIIGYIVDKVANRFSGDSLEQIASATQAEAIGVAFTAVAGALLFVIVGKVTKRQVERCRKYGSHALDQLG